MKERSCGWHQVAFDLRRQGLAPPDIARRVGRNLSTVKWCLNENNEREKTRNRVRKHRGVPLQKSERKTPKQINSLWLCQQFAAGKISRTDLVRQLRSES